MFGNILPNAIGFNFPSDSFCHNVIPRPVLLASVVTILSLHFANCAKPGFSITTLFTVVKSFLFFIQFHSVFLYGSFRNLSVRSDWFGKNFAKYCISARNEFSCFWFAECFRSNIAFNFLRTSSRQFHVPALSFYFERIQNFFSLALYPAFSSFPSTSNSFLCYSLSPRVTTIISFNKTDVQCSSV